MLSMETSAENDTPQIDDQLARLAQAAQTIDIQLADARHTGSSFPPSAPERHNWRRLAEASDLAWQAVLARVEQLIALTADLRRDDDEDLY